MTTVAFRVDADERIGLGHAMRCLALADALRARGATTAFVAAALPEATAAAFRARGHVVLTLANAAGAPSGEPDGALDEAGQRADALAARQALATLGALDWIVVDHYRLGAAWERAAAAFAHRVAVIDDNAWRAHDCDLLIDHNVSAQWAQYDTLLPPRALRLVGPRFALLRREFERERGVAPRARTAVSRLLVSFGGADPTRETEKALRAISVPALARLAADVVVGAANSRLAAIRDLAQRRPATRVHVDADDVEGLMEGADLAIGAAGVSALERCAKGLPSALIVVADNQIPIAQALAQRGAAVSLGRSADIDEERLARAVEGLAAMPDLLQTMAGRAADTCDGHGARRVAARMMSFELRLRPAALADRDRILAWRNDEVTRRFSLDAAPIDPDRHAAWFAQRMNDEDGALLIGEDAHGPVGVLRYDVNGATARVSVYLVPGRHGEGLGALLLHAGHRWLCANRPAVRAIDAEVMAENHASRLAFAEAGYLPRQFGLRRSLQCQE
jgi:UDP-2,4-diacetamido-2,4,6-trideoxy-beta-L-altropyranose hydrolase